MTAPGSVDTFVAHLFRHEAGRIVATLTRVFGLEHLQSVEDAVQDAMIEALRRWPFHGTPKEPGAWIRRVARNRVVDSLRRQGVWRSKRESLRRAAGFGQLEEARATGYSGELADDSLRLVFACCHPLLSRDAGVALTLKMVGGFSIAELSRAFLARPATIAQRLVRAKQRLREGGTSLEIPSPEALKPRLDLVLEVVYLMFNEGYSAHEGSELIRRDLCFEAIRLSRLIADHPATGIPAAQALAALLLFHASRFDARIDHRGELVLLAAQDRSRWDRSLIGEGLARFQSSAAGDELSSYHLQAEIAACHALAPRSEETDWRRILECYDGLLRIEPNPVVAVNRLVALAEVAGAAVALEELRGVWTGVPKRGYLPVEALRGELLARVGKRRRAAESYRRALDLTTSTPIRRFLERRRRSLESET